jgi:MoaA/NifB/PqqE/SkfB family radical SAM enzyme
MLIYISLLDEISGTKRMENISTKRIKITSECNQDCIFCDSNASHDPVLYSEKKINSQISNKDGLKRLNITGGEPTICKNLGKYIKLAKKNGYIDIALLTNGNNFSDKKYALQIKKSGLTEVIVSVYHYDPKINDKISKIKGSFEKKIKGIVNLRNLGIKITVNIVIFSGNYIVIPEIVDYLYSSFDIKNFAFSFLEPNCEKVAGNPKLIPDVRGSLASLKKATSYCDRNDLRYFIPYRGAIPPCIFKMNGINVIKPENIIGADIDLSRTRYSVCRNCDERMHCQGFLKEYAPICADILKKEKK